MLTSIIAFIIGIFGFGSVNVGAALPILKGSQGGTGYSTTTAGNVGKCLSVSSESPLVYTFGDCSGGSSSFSTTSASFFSSVGLAFSTTSSDYWKTQNNFFSTTSATHHASAGLAYSTTSTAYDLSTYDKGYFFSTTSTNYWESTQSRWATTSANYHASVGLAFSTTSTDYWKTQNTFEALTAGDGLTRTSDDFDCDTASGSVFGCLASADWTTFNNKAPTASPTFTGTLTFANLTGTNATSTTLFATYASTSNATTTRFFASFASTTKLWTDQASSTVFSVTSAFYAPFAYFNTTRIGLGSTTPSTLWGNSVGTSTVLQQAQLAVGIASSTSLAATQTVNWSTGNHHRFILNAASTNFVLNSTSSYPLDGGKYTLELCQDGTGSRAAVFVTGNTHIRWKNNATTTITSTANKCTLIYFIYESTYTMYRGVGSTTNVSIN